LFEISSRLMPLQVMAKLREEQDSIKTLDWAAIE
jgi:hypothetical protein